MLKKLGFAVAALLWATMAIAQDDEVDLRWYTSLSGGASYAGTDSAKFGPFGSFSVGRAITGWQGIELEANYLKLNVDDLKGKYDYSRPTVGFNFIQYVLPQEIPIRPYVLANLNYHFISFLDEKLSGGGVGVGGGAMLNLSPHWDFRMQGRYNLDFINKKGDVPEDTFYLWDFSVGFLYKFGAFPADDDGDGVPNGLDKCPDTPRGVKVYSDGCPIDLDGDGVPDYLDKCPNTPKGTAVGPDGCPLDSDGDGVPDNLDRCPGTPPGAIVDANGCPVDSDGDGVPDFLDKCPGTPAGVKVDPNGCPLDSDGDGIPDYLDQCPKTAPGQAVNAVGCPIADSDGDGIPDNLDKCPNTPVGQKVGPDGCPLDSDGDGIPDDQDQCPNTPPGLKVLPDGCAPAGDCRKPRPGEAVDARGCALDRRFVLRGVKFEFDSDRLLPESKVILKEVAETLGAYPNIKVDVEGHTDWIGTEAYNLGLSERRAIAVQKFLEDNGVQMKRLKPVGYGESNPIDTNDTEEGRENNRRVEFKVTEG
jgi:OOP family OmpA-OmpF porin